MLSSFRSVLLLSCFLSELLVFLPCSTSAVLDVKKRQRDVEVRGQGQTLAWSGAADEAPDPPQNLQAISQSYDIVLLVWDKPDDDADVNHYFLYVEGEDIDGIATGNNFLFQNLEACTNYTFGATSVSATGAKSDPIFDEEQTDVGPPPPPQKLEVDRYTSTTVTLTWDTPDTLCDIEEYHVKWGEDDVNIEDMKVKETSFTVTNLAKNTIYTFSVSAFTSYGEGPEATIKQTTTEDDGGPPENLVAVGVSTSAINVSWSPPMSKPSYYLVKAPPCTFSEDITFELFYVITGLDPCETCSFTVTSVYNGSGYQYPENILGTSQNGDPPPPGSCSVEVGEGAVTAIWERPETSCLLGQYNMSWTWTKLWGNGEKESDSKNISGTRYTVMDPVPYSEYSFDVASSIDGVFGSPASCSGTSLETLPGAPVILTVDPVEGKALVTWETPAEENGVIVNYEIFVNEEEDPVQVVDGTMHSTSVGLPPCVSVGLSVKARNNAGLGPPSEVEDLTVVQDVLPENVNCAVDDFLVEVCWKPFSDTCPVSQYNLEWEGDVLWSDDLVDSNSTTMEWTSTEACYYISALPYTEYSVDLTVGSETGSRSCSVITPMAAPGPPGDMNLRTEDLVIHVTWTEPEEKNGIIEFYEVEWKGMTSENGSHTTENNITFSYEIIGFSCGSAINVTVRAKVEDVDEFGESSPQGTAYLLNSVKTLECESSEPGKVSLSWTLEDEECPISSYNLTWTYDSLWSDDTGRSSQSIGKEENSFTVDSLPPYSSVLLQIHVDNSPSSKECTVITPEETSTAPTAVEQIANDTSSVKIKWGLPESINGIFSQWHVNWTTENDDTQIGSSIVTDIEVMTHEITDLSSSSTYVVYITAVNGAGEGEPGKTKASTAYFHEPEGANLNLIIGLSVGGGILLIILLVSGFIIYRKRGSSNPPRSAPHMPKVADADSDELYKMQHLSSASQRFQNKIGSVDVGTNSELYTSPRPSLPKNEPNVDDDAYSLRDDQLTSADDRGPMFGAPADRRFSQQVSTSLPRLNVYNRRPSQQVNSRMRNFEEYNRRPSQQDLVSRPSLSGGPARPSLGEIGRRTSQQAEVGGRPNLSEYGRRPSQQVDLGRPNLSEYGRRPSQQIDLGRPNLSEYGRRPSQQVNLGGPNSREYGRRPSQQADLGKSRLGEFGRRPSQQIDLSKPRLAEYGRRPSQQIDIGKPKSGEYARRPSQQLPSGGGSYPPRLPQQEVPRRSSVDLYNRRRSQDADIGVPGDRMFVKRPSKQFVMSFEGIEEL